ncbi:kinesin-like protein KIN-1 isoform X2 [Cucumis melo var. makuwa]|uniref:Kinesin-like protein n=1 Tax=Cucumis melo var. makuwa TaxID=1194695 RepID=A0A5D3E0L6_CUCMM|nr:kinesin-like protein KIN-1 isoform X2 [Cucumis melo var. makuwa]
MSNITVCARFRPLSSKERRDHGDADEKAEELTFSFDRVFYDKSEQIDVYRHLAQPIVRVLGDKSVFSKCNSLLITLRQEAIKTCRLDALNAVNGTIITFGQTGAGKTYSMEGPGVLECDAVKKGLLSRVVEGIFECTKSSDETSKYSIKLSMMTIKDPQEALLTLSKGIANRAVGETQMNIASSRSHCVYMFTIQQESTKDKRARTGKLNLVDLAGSEKVEKTGAEGRVLEEAKTINKSLSALGNVINALTCGPMGRGNHIPYRDSKLTRILQDALGGNSRTALLCCCSPSPTNSSETLSTLRFGARAKHIKASPRVANEDRCIRELEVFTPIKRESRDKLLNEENLDIEHVQKLEELFIQEGILFDPCSIEESELAYEDVTSQTISSLQLALEELLSTIGEGGRIPNRFIGAPFLDQQIFQTLIDSLEHLSWITKSFKLLLTAPLNLKFFK